MLAMEDTEKSKNKEMAINDNKYKDLRCFLKVSFMLKWKSKFHFEKLNSIVLKKNKIKKQKISGFLPFFSIKY